MKIQQEYKGVTMRLEAHGSYCSEFSLTFLDAGGNEVRHLPTAGSTEDRAFERGREFIDTLEALSE